MAAIGRTDPGALRHEVRLRACAGLERRYGPSMAPGVQARLSAELELLDHERLVTCHVAAELVEAAHRAGIRFGPGAGTMASSLLYYALGLTDVDPLRWGLRPERHWCAPDANDVRVDVAPGERERLLAVMRARWGAGRVAPALHDRGLPGSAGSGFPTLEVLVAPEGAPGGPDRGHAPAGMPPEDEVRCSRIVAVELGVLDSLHCAEARLREQDPAFCLSRIPFGDEATVARLRSGEGSGIVGIDSPNAAALLRRIRPRSFDDLVTALACMHRIASGARLADRWIDWRDAGVPRDDGPLARWGSEYGLLVWQETVIGFLVDRLGYAPSAAYGTWRLLESGGSDGAALEAAGRRFHAACADAAGPVADALWALLRAATPAAQLRAHAVAHAMHTWRSAWIAAHHPTVWRAVRRF
ncbi:MAG: hypothetical protein U0V73_09475 [Acidimicrobiia bacterium]